MARTVTFDVLAVAKAIGFDELGNKIRDSAKNASTGISPLVTAIAALGPAAIPAGAALTGALIGIAPIAGVAILALKGIQQEYAKGHYAGTQFGRDIASVKTEIGHLKEVAASGVVTGMSAQLHGLSSLFPELNRLTAVAAKQLGQIAGNVGVGLIALFTRLQPLFASIGDQVVKLSAGFARWATSSTGVTKFGEYAQQNLPRVEKIVGQIAVAVGHLVQAMVPLGGVSFSTIGVFSKLVASIPTSQLKIIAPLIAGIIVATKAWEVAAKALNIVLAANPFVAVAGAVLILSAAFVKLMQTNRAFRKFMEDSFISIASTAIHAMQSINHGFFSPFLTGLADVFRALGYLPGTLGHNFRAAANAVAGFRDDVTRQLNAAQQRLGSLRAHVDIVNAANDVARLKAEIAGVRSKSISITTYLQQVILPTLGTPGGSHDSRQPYTGLTAPYARAGGGPVMAGHSYIVGELRPEVFTPSTSGYITPYVPSGGHTTVTNNITVNGGDPRALARVLEQFVGAGGKLHILRGLA